jgi:hypothetical protein
MVFRLNDNASAQWMSERVGVVDVTVRSETAAFDWFEHRSQTAGIVTEPKVFPPRHPKAQRRRGHRRLS